MGGEGGSEVCGSIDSATRSVILIERSLERCTGRSAVLLLPMHMHRVAHAGTDAGTDVVILLELCRASTPAPEAPREDGDGTEQEQAANATDDAANDLLGAVAGP